MSGVPLAHAVTLDGFSTRMEIDGNKTNGAAPGFDWNDIQDGTLPGGYVISPGIVSAGVVEQTYQIDGPSITQSCGVTESSPTSGKLDTNPWADTGPVNSKNDICSGGAALEVVDDNGHIHYILYQYYTRTPSATGDQSVLQFLEGPNPGRCDDLLVNFDFGPSSGTNVVYMTWTPALNDDCANPLGAGTWTVNSISATLPTAVGPNPELPNANDSTFGESAIDLTAAGFVPENRCVEYTTGATITYTGNSDNASLKDIMYFSNPIRISNCAQVSIAKQTQPQGITASSPFQYKFDQLDQQPTHGTPPFTATNPGPTATGGGADTDSSVASVTSNIVGGATHLWSNVIAAPDYRLAETSIPANWTLQNLTCTFYDPFFVVNGAVQPQVRTTSSATSPLAPWVIPPPISDPTHTTTSCTITNTTSAVKIVKAGAPAGSTQFPFTATGQAGFNLAIGGDTTVFYTPGTAVTISEGTLPAAIPAWTFTSVSCVDGGGNPVGTPAGQSVSLTTIGAQLITCTFTNTQKGKIVIQKQSIGGTGSFDFTGAVAGSITTTTDGNVSGTPLSVEVAPGTYAEDESVPNGWTRTGTTCSDGSTVDSISVSAGETVICTFTNTKNGNVSLTKSVDGVAAGYDWGPFSFTLNGPLGPVAPSPQTVSGTGPTDGTPVAVTPGWSGLNPGDTYTLTEDPVDGWTSVLRCNVTDEDGDPNDNSVTFTVAAGAAIGCQATNTPAPASVQITKHVSGVGAGFDWGTFNFSIAPTTGVTGASPQTVSPASPTASWSGLTIGQTYTLDETDQRSGWTLTWSCTSAGQPVADADGDPSNGFQLVAAIGEALSCTATNAAPAADLTVDKFVTQVDSTLAWAFDVTLSPLTGVTGASPQTVSGAGVNVTPSTASWSGLTPGRTYTVNEGAHTGYDFFAFCSDATGNLTDADSGAAGFQFVAQPGQSITCVFDNVAQQGQVTITKNTTGIKDGTPWSFDFTIDGPVFSPPDEPTQTISGVGPNAGTSQAIWGALQPGSTYTITETAVPGWTQTLSCTGVTDTNALPNAVTFVAALAVNLQCTATNTPTPAQLTVTKTVSGIDPGLAWSFDFTITPASGVQPASTQSIAGTGNTSNLATWSNLLPGETYTLIETPVAGWTQTLSCAGVTDLDGDPANGIQFVATPGQALACSATNAAQPGTLIVNKTTIGGDGTFSFTLVPDDIAIPDVTTSSGSGTTSGLPGLIPGSSYAVAETDPGINWQAQGVVCAGAGNRSVDPAAIVASPAETITCTFTNVHRAPVTVVKSVTSGPTHVAGTVDQWDVTYQLTLTSTSSIVETVTVTDVLALGGGITVVGTPTVTSTPGLTVDPSWNGTSAHPTLGTATVAANGTLTIPISVRLQVSGTSSSTDRDCTLATSETGTGSLNRTQITNDLSDSSSSACVEMLLPNVSIVKTVVTEPVRNADGTFTLEYGIAVANAASAGNGTYDLSDTFRFGNGITVTAASITQAPAGVTTNPSFGASDTTIATGVPIGPGITHGYRVRVTVSVAVSAATDGDCVSVDREGTGLLNTASVSVRNFGTANSSVCRGLATLTLVKQVINNDGGTATPANFTLTAAQAGSTILSGAGGASGGVLAGTYELSESSFGGYTTTGYSCSGARFESGVVEVHDGDNAVCTIVNDDPPIDLALDKSDGGAFPMPGTSFTYTLTVSNAGTTNPAVGEPITVIDDLPAGISFASPLPAGCSTSGQRLTCTVAPSALQVGQHVVISFPATVNADASGTVVNKAWVTTQHDPACAGTDCVPPCPGVSAGGQVLGASLFNNTDCEDTPIQPPPPVELPVTGSNAAGTINLALVVTLGGVLLVLLRRRLGKPTS